MTEAQSSASNSTGRLELSKALLSYPSLVSFEENLSKQPYSVSLWYGYLTEVDELRSALEELQRKNQPQTRDSKRQPFLIPSSFPPRRIPPRELKESARLLKIGRWMVGERSLSLLPGSYKLWKCHLDQLLSLFPPPERYAIRSREFRRYESVTGCFERSLVRLNKMPRIWTMYFQFVMEYDPEKCSTRLRGLLDRALVALPATQHELIWKECLVWVKERQETIPAESILRLLKRYLVLNPGYRESFVGVCMALNRQGEGALILMAILNEDLEEEAVGRPNQNGKTRHQLWMDFCDICTRYPGEVKRVGINFDGIVRAVMLEKELVKEMEGVLWKNLGMYYVRNGDFEMARSVYEEALDKVVLVRDFSLVFDAYADFEEKMVEKVLEFDLGTEGGEDDLDILVGGSVERNQTSAELVLARAEHLMERRPLLMNRVLLRQNCHNVGQWLHRAELFVELNRWEEAVRALESGVKVVRSRKATEGTLHELWIKLASLHEEKGDLEAAREVFGRAAGERFHNVDHLALCRASRVEMELRHNAYQEALEEARRSVAPKQKTDRSLRLWNLVLDLEESLGTVDTTKAAYDRCLHLKVATPHIVLNYAEYLRERQFYEEAFSALEKGLALFPFSVNAEASTRIWTDYLESFVKRYAGSKLERARDLFERCVTCCPAEVSSRFFSRYAAFEEEYGQMVRRALGLYERMCTAVPIEEKKTSYELYVAKTKLFLGVTKTRSVFEAGISACRDVDAAVLCRQYADMESSLGEIERARAVWTFGAQLVDPSRDVNRFWTKWHEFEVSNGDEETFRDMLRIKRGVIAAFSTVNYNAREMGAGVLSEAGMAKDENEALAEIVEREGVQMQVPVMDGFVATQAPKKRKAPESVDLGMLEQRAAKLRSVVAGDIAAATKDDAVDEDEISLGDENDEVDEDDHRGALDRFRESVQVNQ